MLMSKMIEGFPEHIKQLPVVLRPFWQIKDDLSIEAPVWHIKVGIIYLKLIENKP